jgi:hypothetical protein
MENDETAWAGTGAVMRLSAVAVQAARAMPRILDEIVTTFLLRD